MFLVAEYENDRHGTAMMPDEYQQTLKDHFYAYFDLEDRVMFKVGQNALFTGADTRGCKGCGNV